MRLLVVALLGIEITIIALASTAFAATHPQGTAAQGGLHQARPTGWQDDPAQWGTTATFLTDGYEMGGYEMGAGRAGTWAYDSLMAAGERLDMMRHWPTTLDSRWLFGDSRWTRSYSHRHRGEAHRADEAHAREVRADKAHAQARADEVRAHEVRAPQVWEPTVEERADVITAALAAPAEAAEAALAQVAQAPLTAARAPKKRVRTGVAKMPRARTHVAHKRAQIDLARVLPRRAAVQMSHASAEGWLKSAGLRTKSTGNCVSKHQHHCTSLDSVRTGTIAKVIELKQESGCPIMVTGGTERGHAPGQFSHGNGYKLDISHNACIDRHITKNHDKAGVRSDGARLYKSASGTTFADESDHWDILFR
ncbi:hypothetical protein GCM10022224_037810 [Nonomuraea antimicrobica]|uniref:D-alanyl-D-alanine carboxypeptidase n=1 Tax=Nonomuraea antimicrobica TaxID=561173 RepID=A0ABP7BXL5_9ACTN